jgi:hypothetical protein
LGHGDPPTDWKGLNNPPVIAGGLALVHDPVHNVLYSSNSTAGFYRLVLK